MNVSTSKLFQALTLPNGQTIPNRLCKAAMEENLSDEGQIRGIACISYTGAGPRVALDWYSLEM